MCVCTCVHYELRIMRSSSFCIYPFSTRDRVAVKDKSCMRWTRSIRLLVSSSPISSSVFRRTATRPIERVTSRFARNTVFQSLSRCFNLSRLLFYALRILPNILRTGSTIFTSSRVISRTLFFSFVFFPNSFVLTPASHLRHSHEEERESDVSRCLT